MQATFEKCQAAAQAIDGMLSEFSIGVMDTFLSFQKQNEINGNIMEFGVYKGKSAAVLAQHLQASERLILVDVNDQLDRELIASQDAWKSQIQFFQGDTRNIADFIPYYRSLLNTCRFVHIDASHQFDPTLKELELAEGMLSPNGLIVCDDYTNLDYSQNIAAIMKYLFTSDTKLTPVLVTAEKCYLCYRDFFGHYGSFVLADIVESMSKRGFDTAVARTDASDEYRAFHLRGRRNGEGRLIAFDIYKGYYEAP